MALRPSRPQSRSDQLATRPAARDRAQDEVFLREVDEALREDQLRTAARRYGLLVAVVVIAALAALGGFLWWQARQAAAADRGGEELVVALDQVEAGRAVGASPVLATLSKDATKGYRATSLLLRAGLASEQGRAAEAQRLLGQVAADADAAEPFRDLAKVREVALAFDTLPPEQVIARLKPLAAPGNPWFGSAGELVGAAYLKQGRQDLAGPLFAAIAKDETVPATLRSRARQIAGVLGVDAISDVDKAVSGSIVAGAGQPS